MIRATPPWLFLPGSTRSSISTIVPTSKGAPGPCSPALVSAIFSFVPKLSSSFASPSAPSDATSIGWFAGGTTSLPVGSAFGAAPSADTTTGSSLFAFATTGTPLPGAFAATGTSSLCAVLGPAETVGSATAASSLGLRSSAAAGLGAGTASAAVAPPSPTTQ